MSEESIVRYTAEEIDRLHARGEDRTDWARLRAMTEEELEASIASDPDWADMSLDWSKAEAHGPSPSGRVAVAPDVLAWFRERGADYEARINDVLRAYARSHAAE